MHPAIDFIIKAYKIIGALGVVIFVHELGHFLAAKRIGVKVEKFFLGLGPEFLGFTSGGTRYGLGIFPVGGMVKLAGEEISREKAAPGEFFHQPWYKRIFVTVSGAAMNLIFAVLLFSALIYAGGVGVVSDDPVIGVLSEDMPAKAAGLLSGDRIFSVEGKDILTWRDLAAEIHARPDAKVRLGVERDGKRFFKSLVTDGQRTKGVGLIGISPSVKTERAGAFRSVYLGAKQSVFLNYITLAYLWDRLINWQKPELSGPVGIVGELGKAASRGTAVFISYIALISNALALFNLLPIPMLDGGLSVFFLFEGITGKSLNEKIMARINTVGLAFIISLFLYVTYGDIARLAVRG
jgi:regulator of sigma E protease